MKINLCKKILTASAASVFALLMANNVQAASVWSLELENGSGAFSINLVSSLDDTLTMDSFTDAYIDTGTQIDLSLLFTQSSFEIASSFGTSQSDLYTTASSNFSFLGMSQSGLSISFDRMSVSDMNEYYAETIENAPVGTYACSEEQFESQCSYSDFELGDLLGLNAINQPIGSIVFNRTAVSTVPVPAAVWLFGSGLVSLIGFAKRRKA